MGADHRCGPDHLGIDRLDPPRAAHHEASDRVQAVERVPPRPR